MKAPTDALFNRNLCLKNTRYKREDKIWMFIIKIAYPDRVLTFKPGLNRVCVMPAVRYLVIVWEDIQGQRFLSLIDKLDRFVQAADWQDGKQRSEYLLLHHLRLWLHVPQNCGGWTQHTNIFITCIVFNVIAWMKNALHAFETPESHWFMCREAAVTSVTYVAVWLVILSSRSDGAVLHHGHYPLEVALVDDAAVVCAGLWVVCVEILSEQTLISTNILVKFRQI